MGLSIRLTAVLALYGGALAHAEPDHASDLTLDGGLIVALPAALPTGLSTGVEAGVARGGTWAWGVRAGWSTATEYTTDFTVRHDDLRLRLTGEVRHVAGRGTVALRLGAGGTLVREDRTRDQAARAGATGTDLETTAASLLPAMDLEISVVVKVYGAWSLSLAGGPSVDLLDGSLHAGWVGGLGVAWRR